MAVDLAPRDVQTTLNYHQPQDQLPYYYVGCQPPAGMPVCNVGNEPHSAIIHDARGKQDAFSLDISGFQWVNYPSAEKEFIDRERIKTVYYGEVEDILKRYAGETKPARLTARGPAHIVHADQSFAAAEQKVRECLPDDAERLLKGRYQIINVWRSAIHIHLLFVWRVLMLRMTSAPSIVDADLVPVRMIYSNRESGSYNVKYNPEHKWYYLSDQTPDEVMLLKCFDSDTDKARLAPHSAFPDGTSPADAPHRQSIEVRALVFDRE
ncbi:hypothetical protein JVT61DRAFT_4529 [Boletus reticuloceps]|uniref:Methyltransferase n=1 Tax=Boletus reticuloceps TaxID=495285 RepID=A0A8I2YM49_9AGAM|nr:hypothetical protein JVT61DRAFT_4529 [Boletus reticuloceps]